MKLLTREEFNKAVFAASKDKCVFCDLPAVDAHHILERKLFQDGGYYLENGAAVCEKHHLDCETTILSVEDVRLAADITNPAIPSGFDPTQRYDKWGNRMIDDRLRIAGPLAQDDGCRRSLARAGLLGYLLQNELD